MRDLMYDTLESSLAEGCFHTDSAFARTEKFQTLDRHPLLEMRTQVLN